MKRNITVRHSRHGMALVVVIVLVMLITLAAYRFTFYMESQHRLVKLRAEQKDAQNIAWSGLEYAASLLERSSAERASRGGMFHNSNLFQHRNLTNDEASPDSRDPRTWSFSIVSSAASSPSNQEGSATYTFGLINETAKVSLSSLRDWDRLQPGLAKRFLLSLPQANEPEVDAWLIENGFANTVSSLSNSIDRRPIDATVDLSGWWLGGDWNQNYRIDPIEQNLTSALTDLSSSATTNDAQATPAGRALQNYVTTKSGVRNETMNGEPRIFLNDPNLTNLHATLMQKWPADWVKYVIAVRQYGIQANTPQPVANGTSSAPSSMPSASPNSASFPPARRLEGPPLAPSLGPTQPPNPAQPTSTLQTIEPAPQSLTSGITISNTSTVISLDSWTPDLSRPPIYTLQSVLDLAGTQVEIPAIPASSGTPASTNPGKQILRSPFSDDSVGMRNYVERLLDEATTSTQPFFEGRIDVSEATLPVLMAVPGMDLTLAQKLVEQRASGTATSNRSVSIAWLLDGNLVTVDRLRLLEPYLTSRSDVYSLQVIGYRDSKSPVHRCTALLDARSFPTRIERYQVWHPWDRGFDLDRLSNTVTP